MFGCNRSVGCSRTVACNETVTSANHIKCTQLNPPITEVNTITTATTTHPNKVGIFNPKWMNMQHFGSVSTSDIFSYFGHFVRTNALSLKRNASIFSEIVMVIINWYQDFVLSKSVRNHTHDLKNLTPASQSSRFTYTKE